jgi:Ca2+-binding RTX toxin-like protein
VRRGLLLAVAAAASLAGLAPAGASASSARLETGGGARFTYFGGTGERNDVRVVLHSPSSLTVSDAGGSFSPPDGCTSGVDGAVTCTASEPFRLVSVEAGDADDSVLVDTDAAPDARVELAGGEGDNQLVVSGGARATFSGGPGDDAMSAEDGTGTVTYADHARAVGVDLGAGRGGSPGEHDSLSGMSAVVGTPRSDTLVGSDGADVLSGGGGDDTLVGHGGSDTLLGSRGNDALLGEDGDDLLIGGPGADALFGGKGDDRVVSSEGGREQADTVGCGSGFDIAQTSAAPGREVGGLDLLTADCERVDAGLRGGPLSVPPRPLRAGHLALGARCGGGARGRCLVRLTASAGGRRIASGHGSPREGRRATVRAALTRAGRRFVAGGGAASVRIRAEVLYHDARGVRHVERTAVRLLLVLS